MFRKEHSQVAAARRTRPPIINSFDIMPLSGGLPRHQQHTFRSRAPAAAAAGSSIFEHRAACICQVIRTELCAFHQGVGQCGRASVGPSSSAAAVHASVDRFDGVGVKPGCSGRIHWRVRALRWGGRGGGVEEEEGDTPVGAGEGDKNLRRSGRRNFRSRGRRCRRQQTCEQPRSRTKTGQHSEMHLHHHAIQIIPRTRSNDPLKPTP